MGSRIEQAHLEEDLLAGSHCCNAMLCCAVLCCTVLCVYDIQWMEWSRGASLHSGNLEVLPIYSVAVLHRSEYVDGIDIVHTV
jgi:hypothetical protein